MKRIQVQNIEAWYNGKNRKPLIVWGARQVGKTHMIKELFAPKYFKDKFLYIDFKIEDEISAFCEETANPEKIMDYISLVKGKSIDERTLLIFDEIQECPNIISSLKYFCQDYPQIPVIATGSMVRIKLQREAKKRSGETGKFLFPVGKIQQLTVYPMTFDEYLLNKNEQMYNTVKEAYEAKRPLSGSVHQLVLNEVYNYLLVGGMPEALNDYIEEGNFIASRLILQNLYDNYLDDMELYQASQEAVLRSRKIFDNIYKELNRENKNFSPGFIEEKSKVRDYASAINWLTTAHVVNQSHQLKESVTMPLMRENDSYFRLFLGDVGMFAYQSGINAASFISPDRENTLSGIFFENFVADELVAKGNPLFYWKGKSTAELEFILESNNELYPVDVKKGRGVLNSLEKFSNHNRFTYAIKISKNNMGYDATQRIWTIPFYFVPFLAMDVVGASMPEISALEAIRSEQ